MSNEGELLVGILSDLVSFPSINGSENELSDYLSHLFEGMGLNSYQQVAANGMKNAIGSVTFGRGGQTILLNSHMDVVEPGLGWNTDPYKLVVKDGKAYGRGATDAKGALSCLIYAVQRILETPQDVNGTIILTAVVDEELHSCGARALCENGISADYAIVGEPTLSRIGICHNGSIRPVIAIRGKSAHSAYPELGINAIRIASFISKCVDEIASEIGDISHPLTGKPSISITCIKGGLKENIVPDYCELVIDRRIVPGESDVDIIYRFEKLCKESQEEFPGSRVYVDRYLVTTGPASQIDAASELVCIAQKARQNVLGESDQLVGLLCNTDMNHFVRKGIPTVIIGPGSIEIAHKPNEYVEVEELVKASAVQEAVIRALL